MTGPGNGLAWQVADHEKRLSAAEAGIVERERRVSGLERDSADCSRRLLALEAAKVDVLADRLLQLQSQVTALRGEVANGREEVAGFKQTFLRFALGLFGTILAGVVVAYLVTAVH